MVPKSVRSKRGCVNLLVYSGSKCVQGGRGSKKPKNLRTYYLDGLIGKLIIWSIAPAGSRRTFPPSLYWVCIVIFVCSKVVCSLVFVPVQDLLAGPTCCCAFFWYFVQFPSSLLGTSGASPRTAYHPVCPNVYTKIWKPYTGPVAELLTWPVFSPYKAIPQSTSTIQQSWSYSHVS